LRLLRTFVTALLLAAGLTLGPLAAAAHAAGPGVALYVNTIPQPIDIPGERFAGGMSIRALLESNAVDPSTVTFVNVTRADAGQVALTQADFGAVIIDDGTTTRFVRGATRITATADTGPLQISVNGGDISVVAAVDHSAVQAKERVSFSARVRFAPPGAQLRYEWDFGDGSAPGSGQFASHVYATGGNFEARVTVTGTNGSSPRCATSCVGHDDVDVTVGEPPPEPIPPPQTGGGGTGTSPGSGSGSGTGGDQAGGGSGTGSDPSGTAKPTPNPPPPPPPPKKPFGVPISGVLISGPGTTLSKLPAGKAPGTSNGQRRRDRDAGDPGIELPIGGALALMVLAAGALRERRGVRLRLA
jgi:hypothetical protein